MAIENEDNLGQVEAARHGNQKTKRCTPSIPRGRVSTSALKYNSNNVNRNILRSTNVENSKSNIRNRQEYSSDEEHDSSRRIPSRESQNLLKSTEVSKSYKTGDNDDKNSLLKAISENVKPRSRIDSNRKLADKKKSIESDKYVCYCKEKNNRKLENEKAAKRVPALKQSPFSRKHKTGKNINKNRQHKKPINKNKSRHGFVSQSLPKAGSNDSKIPEYSSNSLLQGVKTHGNTDKVSYIPVVYKTQPKFFLLPTRATERRKPIKIDIPFASDSSNSFIPHISSNSQEDTINSEEDLQVGKEHQRTPIVGNKNLRNSKTSEARNSGKKTAAVLHNDLPGKNETGVNDSKIESDNSSTDPSLLEENNTENISKIDETFQSIDECIKLYDHDFCTSFIESSKLSTDEGIQESTENYGYSTTLSEEQFMTNEGFNGDSINYETTASSTKLQAADLEISESTTLESSNFNEEPDSNNSEAFMSTQFKDEFEDSTEATSSLTSLIINGTDHTGDVETSNLISEMTDVHLTTPSENKNEETTNDYKYDENIINTINNLTMESVNASHEDELVGQAIESKSIKADSHNDLGKLNKDKNAYLESMSEEEHKGSNKVLENKQATKTEINSGESSENSANTSKGKMEKSYRNSKNNDLNDPATIDNQSFDDSDIKEITVSYFTSKAYDNETNQRDPYFSSSGPSSFAEFYITDSGPVDTNTRENQDSKNTQSIPNPRENINKSTEADPTIDDNAELLNTSAGKSSNSKTNRNSNAAGKGTNTDENPLSNKTSNKNCTENNLESTEIDDSEALKIVTNLENILNNINETLKEYNNNGSLKQESLEDNNLNLELEEITQKDREAKAEDVLPFCDNTLLQKSIKMVINNFATKDSNDRNENMNEEIVGSVGEDLLSEITEIPNLKGILKLPPIEDTIVERVKDFLSKMTKIPRKSFNKDWSTKVIRHNLRHMTAALPSATTELPPLTVVEHQFKNGAWRTHLVTLSPILKEDEEKLPTKSKALRKNIKNLLREPAINSAIVGQPAVRNMIVQSVRNVLDPEYTASDESIDSEIQIILNNEIREIERNDAANDATNDATTDVASDASKSETLNLSDAEIKRIVELSEGMNNLDKAEERSGGEEVTKGDNLQENSEGSYGVLEEQKLINSNQEAELLNEDSVQEAELENSMERALKFYPDGTFRDAVSSEQSELDMKEQILDNFEREELQELNSWKSSESSTEIFYYPRIKNADSSNSEELVGIGDPSQVKNALENQNIKSPSEILQAETNEEGNLAKQDESLEKAFESIITDTVNQERKNYVSNTQEITTDMDFETTSNESFLDDNTAESSLPYFGKISLLNKKNCTDLKNFYKTDLYYVGDGVKLPLEIRGLKDGSYALSISRKLCEHIAIRKCPCCVPVEGNIVRSTKPSLKSKREDITSPNKEFKTEKKRNIFKYQAPKLITLIERKKRDSNNENVESFSMPVKDFIKKYNLSLNLEEVENSNRERSIQERKNTDIDVVEDLLAIHNVPIGRTKFVSNIKNTAGIDTDGIGGEELLQVGDSTSVEKEDYSRINRCTDTYATRYGHRGNNPVGNRMKFLKEQQQAQQQYRRQRNVDGNSMKGVDALKSVLRWLKGVVLSVNSASSSRV